VYQLLLCTLAANRKSDVAQALKNRQRGFTLIELLVTVVLSSGLILIISNLYLSIFTSQRAQYEKTAMYENANTALALIGRNIELAGYYPLNFGIDQTGNANIMGGYNDKALAKSTQNTSLPVYKFPINGCTSQYWEGSTGICTNQAAGVDSDSIVINYFTDDPFFNTVGGLDLGIAANCVRARPDNVINKANTQVFLISNRYSLALTNRAYVEKANVSMTNLACDGNASPGSGSGYEALVEGIDQLRFTYLESTGLNTQFVRSSAVTDWSNVIAVKVCLIARSMLATRGAESSYTLNNCDGTAILYSDGISREKFSQVFSIKNSAKNVRLAQ